MGDEDEGDVTHRNILNMDFDHQDPRLLAFFLSFLLF